VASEESVCLFVCLLGRGGGEYGEGISFFISVCAEVIISLTPPLQPAAVGRRHIDKPSKGCVWPWP